MSDEYSVVMTVYKDDKPAWFVEAIESVLRQTLKSDDIVVVCDGEVPSELEKILKKYEEQATVRVVRLLENIGPGLARNKGVRITKHELIGFMDADDISTSNRFELQVARFRDNQKLAVIGGQIAERRKVSDGVVRYHRFPCQHEEILQFGRRRSPFSTNVMMIKKSAFDKVGGFKNLRCGEDYELAMNMLGYGEGENLSEVILFVRIDGDAITRRKSWTRTKDFIRCRHVILKNGHSGVWDFCLTSAAQLLFFVIPTKVVGKLYSTILQSK